MKEVNWKDRVYQEYGAGIDRDLFESLKATHTISLDQTAFQFGGDGTETGYTLDGILNSDQSKTVDTVFTLRVQVTAVTAGNPAALACGGVLQYFHVEGAAAWVTVTTSSLVVQSVASASMTDDAVTTERLAGAATFVAGRVSEEAGNPTNVDLLKTEETEFVHVIQIVGAEVSIGDTINFHIIGEGDDTTDLTAYSQVPQVTAALASLEILPGVTTLEMTLFAPAVASGVGVLPGVTTLEMVLFLPTIDAAVSAGVPQQMMNLHRIMAQ